MTATLAPARPAEEVFGHGLRGEPCFILGLAPQPLLLPVEDWTRSADASDHAILTLCEGPTLDVGCGPGRLTAALAARGVPVLGVDVAPEAVAQTRRRGASALQRDVFGPLPGAGRWETALLADGNIGIGGDPVLLLERVRELLAPGGRIVVEVGAPGMRSRRVRAQLACACSTSAPFDWAVVGLGDIGRVAAECGLVELRRLDVGGRWVVVLGAVAR